MTDHPAVELLVINEQMANLELLYVDHVGTERRYWVIDARGEFNVSTRTGDLWYLRTKQGQLAARVYVESTDARQTYVVRPCLPASQRARVSEALRFDTPPPEPEDLSTCNPWAHLSRTEPSPGLHVACLLPVSSTSFAAHLVLFADGWAGGAADDRPVGSHSFLLSAADADAARLGALVMARLSLHERGPLHNAPALYSCAGARLASAAHAPADGCVLIFEGGLFMWPAVEVGHVRFVTVSDGAAERNVSLTTLSLRPRVVIADDVIMAGEAELIISEASERMYKSGVSLKANDRGRSSSDYRTSSQWSFPLFDERILPLDRRVQQLTRIPMTHAEQIQVLRYLPGEHYTSHHDFFDPGEYAGRDRERGHSRNRFATVFFYLNEPGAGGETGFPRAGGLPQPRDFLDCSKGLAVKPRERAVMVFYSMLPNGEFDHTSLHTGCDVKVGVKWAANFWFWNQVHNSASAAKRLAAELESME